LYCDRASHSPETKLAADQLARWPLEELSGFILRAIAKEKQVLEVITANSPVYEAELLRSPDIRNIRIAKNHALIMALADALELVLPISKDIIHGVHAYIVQLAKERQRAISADHPIVHEFWEAFDYLNGSPD